MMMSRDKLRIYKAYILPEHKDTPASSLNAADIEVMEEGSDFSVFFLHMFWPIKKSLPWLFFVFLCVIGLLFYANVNNATVNYSPLLPPVFTGFYLLFLLTVAAFGNDWRRVRLLRKGYQESGRVCAANKDRAMEFFFNGAV